MSISKNDLKKIRRFHLASPSELESFDEWALWLESILHNPCSIHIRDGELFLIETKQLVERLAGMRIDIYPNEHPPPHFHIKSPEVDACFTIKDCRQIKGNASPQTVQKISYWHRHSKPKLIEIWNSTRPTSCTVGEYRGN